MEFLDMARARCSIRDYKDKDVEAEKLDLILEAGRIAPTAANRQPQRILVVRSAEGRKKLKKAGNLYDAPVCLIVCADHAACWNRSFDGKNAGDIDTSIVVTHMMLEAADLGLGSIWVCHFDPDALRAEFDLPEDYEPVSILGVGYAAGPVKSPDRHREDRKPLTETVAYEHF